MRQKTDHGTHLSLLYIQLPLQKNVQGLVITSEDYEKI